MSKYSKPSTIVPVNDAERLKKLRAYDILDTHPEEAFDKIAKLAAQIFGTPSAFVTFVDQDRVFFKANISTIPGNVVDRKESLCSLAILEEQITVFNDTHQVPDLLELDHVSCEGGIRFYAGAPLRTSEGFKLGTICVVDSVPRKATEQQLQMLETLSSIIVDELEHRIASKKAIKAQTDLMNRMVHELKNPALNIELLSRHILDEANLDAIQEMAKMIHVSIEGVRNKIDKVLKLSEMDQSDFQLHLKEVELKNTLKQTIKNFNLLAEQKKQTVQLHYLSDSKVLVDEDRIKEVFENLLSNAIKYAYPETTITITVEDKDGQVIIAFKDKGQGLTEADMGKLFKKFAKLSSRPTGKERSSGLGLSIVKMLVELQKGRVWATSDGRDTGATFFVSLPAVG